MDSLVPASLDFIEETNSIFLSVAKAYHKDGEIDASETAKEAVRNDIMLQYEANRWAEQFNQANPPSKIIFIRAYAIEFPNRPGRPWMAVE